MQKINYWIASLGVLSLVACFETEHTYRYISLEQVAGIRVDLTARIEQKKLRGDSAVPIEYTLAREHYTLHFSVVQQSVFPALRVAIEGGDYSLQFHRDENTRAPNGVLCAAFYSVTNTSFDFGWEPGCTAPALRRAIDFDLRNADGAVVARESIVFDLKENGVYSATDAL